MYIWLMENEIWKPVVGYEGLYEVSSYGRVYSLPDNGTPGKFNQGKIKIPQKRRRYLFVKLYKEGMCKAFSIHRLVAEAFIPNPENKPVVDHIDTNCYNNHKSNLRWASYSENSRNPLTIKHRLETKAAKGGKTASKKTFCYKNCVLIKTFDSQNEAARCIGISRRSVYRSIKYGTATKGGYIFSNAAID